MFKEKKQITITITDVDDINKVLEGLEKLFKTILLHYTDNDNTVKLTYFLVACYNYFRFIIFGDKK
jgi:hypothetical protein